MDGKLVEQAPRNVLKRVIADAAAKRLRAQDRASNASSSCIARTARPISDAADHQAKPCYDQQALMRRYDVISEICDAMLELGWKPVSERP